MFTLLKRMLFVLTLALTWTLCSADQEVTTPVEDIISEVFVLSLQFQGKGSASLVARPCDSVDTCDNILARIDEKTVWKDNGNLITYKQAKSLEWHGALLVIDKHNNALVVDRL